MASLTALTAVLLVLAAGQPSHRPIPAALSKQAPTVKWDSGSRIFADINDDQKPDEVFLGRAKGRIYVGIVLGGTGAVHTLDFAIDGGQQAAICAEPALLTTESMNYDPMPLVGRIPGLRSSDRYFGLRLSGGGCDAIHIYWDFEPNEPRWWRP